MHEDDDYNDDHDYDDSQNNPENKYKKYLYFKFDPSAWDWGKWLEKALDDIVESSPNVWYTTFNVSGFPYKSIPVNSWISNTGKGNSFQYLGNDYQGNAIWKQKYFIKDSLQTNYINHISNYPSHFVMQPYYYKGMFDIMN